MKSEKNDDIKGKATGSYKMWPKGGSFKEPGARRAQVACAISTRNCKRYPSKTWFDPRDKTQKTVHASGLFAEKAIAAGAVIFLEQPIVFVDSLDDAVSSIQRKDFPGQLATPFLGNAWIAANQLARKILNQKMGGEKLWNYLWHHSSDNTLVPTYLCDCSKKEDFPVLCSEFKDLPGHMAAILLHVIHDTGFRMKTPLLGFMHGLALYLLGGSINHSCDPNCNAFVRDHESRLLIVKAMRPIKAGEEITVAYEASVCRFSKATERIAYLKYVYGFECVCDRCKKPSVADQRMTVYRNISIETFGRETFRKIRRASVASVQGGPVKSLAILKELQVIWVKGLGNGDPMAMDNLAPILHFEFAWAYVSCLMMLPSQDFQAQLKQGLGLSGSLKLLKSSLVALKKLGYASMAWMFAEPLCAFATMVEQGKLWDPSAHLFFNRKQNDSLVEHYKNVEATMQQLYHSQRLLASDALISDIVMETGRRVMEIMQNQDWLQEEVAKIDLNLNNNDDDANAEQTPPLKGKAKQKEEAVKNNKSL